MCVRVYTCILCVCIDEIFKRQTWREDGQFQEKISGKDRSIDTERDRDLILVHSREIHRELCFVGLMIILILLFIIFNYFLSLRKICMMGWATHKLEHYVYFIFYFGLDLCTFLFAYVLSGC